MFSGTERSSRDVAAESSNGAQATGPDRTLTAHVVEILALVARLVRVRVARRALWLSRGASLALAGIVLAVVCVTAALAGVRLGVRGLTGGFASAFGERTWLAELSSGLVLLGGTVLLLASARAAAERRILRKLRHTRGRKDAAP